MALTYDRDKPRTWLPASKTFKPTHLFEGMPVRALGPARKETSKGRGQLQYILRAVTEGGLRVCARVDLFTKLG